LQQSADFALGSHLPFRQQFIVSGWCSLAAKQSNGVKSPSPTNKLTAMLTTRRILLNLSTPHSKGGVYLTHCKIKANAILHNPPLRMFAQ
jgi:hypothetical protein